jgi:hypothetical protein
MFTGSVTDIEKAFFQEDEFYKHPTESRNFYAGTGAIA